MNKKCKFSSFISNIIFKFLRYKRISNESWQGPKRPLSTHFSGGHPSTRIHKNSSAPSIRSPHIEQQGSHPVPPIMFLKGLLPLHRHVIVRLILAGHPVVVNLR